MNSRCPWWSRDAGICLVVHIDGDYDWIPVYVRISPSRSAWTATIVRDSINTFCRVSTLRSRSLGWPKTTALLSMPTGSTHSTSFTNSYGQFGSRRQPDGKARTSEDGNDPDCPDQCSELTSPQQAATSGDYR